MSLPQLPGSFGDDLAAIKRRLDTLERSTGMFQSVTVQDAAGTQRVLIGKLPSGDYGIRPRRGASGTLIMDSIGLAAVMKSIGSASIAAPGVTKPFTTTTTIIPESSATFALSRATSVLMAWC